jgi:predicted nuclease of predicted toxin-antitoxin system
MKIKVDEILPAALSPRLPAMGHDIETVTDEGIGGEPDSVLWQATQREARFLATQDLHSSDARRFSPGTHGGILLVRLRTPSRKALTARVGDIFAREDAAQWAGCLVVATEHKIRVRRPGRRESRRKR